MSVTTSFLLVFGLLILIVLFFLYLRNNIDKRFTLDELDKNIKALTGSLTWQNSGHVFGVLALCLFLLAVTVGIYPLGWIVLILALILGVIGFVKSKTDQIGRLIAKLSIIVCLGYLLLIVFLLVYAYSSFSSYQ
ncbi:hypothetical protein OAT16_03620 [Prolixibacteraceae bacterium]|nr:hypothetical protein [Prolixibacteraceae bacterium]